MLTDLLGQGAGDCEHQHFLKAVEQELLNYSRGHCWRFYFHPFLCSTEDRPQMPTPLLKYLQPKLQGKAKGLEFNRVESVMKSVGDVVNMYKTVLFHPILWRIEVAIRKRVWYPGIGGCIHILVGQVHH